MFNKEAHDNKLLVFVLKASIAPARVRIFLNRPSFFQTVWLSESVGQTSRVD